MKNSLFTQISSIVLLIVSAEILQGAIAQEEGFESPRIAALAKEIKSGNAAALPSFWEEMKGKAPLVEPIAGDNKNLWVTFVWRGDSETNRPATGIGPPSHTLSLTLSATLNAVLSIHLADNHKIALIRIHGGTHADKYK